MDNTASLIFYNTVRIHELAKKKSQLARDWKAPEINLEI